MFGYKKHHSFFTAYPLHKVTVAGAFLDPLINPSPEFSVNKK